MLFMSVKVQLYLYEWSMAMQVKQQQKLNAFNWSYVVVFGKLFYE